MAKAIKGVVNRIAPIVGFKIKVQERGRTKLQDLLSNKTYGQGPSVGELTAIHANKLATKLRIAWPGIYSMSQCATLVTLEE